MKMKHLTVVGAVVVALGAPRATYAIQKHDPQFSKPLVFNWSAWQNSPDLLTMTRNQNGTPKSKRDLYVVRGVSSAPNRDLAKEILAQTGPPKLKKDVSVLPPSR